MANARRITIEFLGKDKSLGRTADGIEGKTSKLGAGFKKFGKVAAVGFAAAGAAAIKFTKDAAALDSGQREVVTLFGETGKAAEKSLGQVRDITRKVSDQFGVAQETLTSGLYSAISAGVPKENALTFMQVASKAAIAGVTDVETAVDGITTTVNAFGLKASDAEKISDSMFTAVKGGKTTFEELSDSLFNVAPAAAAASVKFTEVNAALAALTAGGTPTKVATTQLRAALVGLQKPSEAMDKIFQKLGHENAQVAIESKGLGFALDAVKKASKGNNGELQKLLGSSEAVAAANVLAGTGAEKFTKELKAQADAAGATGKAYDVVNKGAARQFEILKTRLQNVSIEIGQKLLPVAVKLAAWANEKMVPAVSKLSSFLGQHLGPVFESIGGFLSKTFIPAVKDLIDRFTGAKDGTDKVGKAMKDAQPYIETVKAILKGLGVVFKKVLLPVMGKIADHALPALGKALGLIGKVAQFIWNNALQPMFKFLVRAIGEVMIMWGKMLRALGKVPGFGWAKKAADAMENAGEKAVDLSKDIKKIPDADVDVNVNLDQARRDLSTFVRTASGQVIRMQGQVATGPNAVRAHGGSVMRSRGYLVGERGPEWFTPSTNGRISSTKDTMAAATYGTHMGGGVNINVTVNGVIGDRRSVGREVEKALNEWLRSRGRGLAVPK